MLVANYELTEKPEILKSLPPDAFAMLSLAKMGAEDKVIGPIAHLTGLRRLDIDGSEITNDKTMSQLKTLTNLEALSAWACGLKGTFFKDWSGMKNMRFLMVGDNKLEPEAYKAMATNFPKLEVLNAVRSGVDDKSLEYIGQIKSLKVLRIPRNNGFTAKGLLNLKGIKHLDWLHLGETSINPDGIIGLKGLNVDMIALPQRSYTPAQMAKLKAAFPKTVFTEREIKIDSDTAETFKPLPEHP